MTPTDIIALGQAFYGEPWLEKMAADLEYSASQLGRMAYDGATVTRRIRRGLDKLMKRKAGRDRGGIRSASPLLPLIQVCIGPRQGRVRLPHLLVSPHLRRVHADEAEEHCEN